MINGGITKHQQYKNIKNCSSPFYRRDKKKGTTLSLILIYQLSSPFNQTLFSTNWILINAMLVAANLIAITAHGPRVIRCLAGLLSTTKDFEDAIGTLEETKTGSGYHWSVVTLVPWDQGLGIMGCHHRSFS